MNHSASSTHESGDLALTVLLQGVAAGRRVLWVGDPSTGGAERIASFAHDVRVLDTTGRARRRRAGSARISPMPARGLDLDGDGFDIAIVPDLAVFDDLAIRLAELAEAVGDGVVLAGFSATTARYEECSPIFERTFREVRLLGQGRFAGSAFADLDIEQAPTELVVDGTLLSTRAEPIDRYLILAADELPAVESLLVVQTPTADLVSPPEDQRDREVGALRQELERAESRLQQAQTRLVATESELAESRAALKADEAPTEGGSAAEVGRLENALRDAARRNLEATAELSRRETLVRDLVEELREHTTGRRGRSAGGSTDALLEAEAALSAAQFENDELRASLAARPETAPSPETAAHGSDMSARLGQLSGALVQAESTVADALASRDRARAETLKLNAQIGALETRMEGMQLGYEHRIAMMGPSVDTSAESARTREIAQLKGEVEGLRLRLADLSASAASQSVGVDALDRADALQAEVEALRRENGELTLNLADATERDDAQAATVRDLSAAMASRDALVTRLQMDLAEEEQVRRANDHESKRSQEEIVRLRAGILEASDAVDDRDRARAAHEETKAELTAVTSELEALRSQAESASASAESTAAAEQAAREAAETAAQTSEALEERLAAARAKHIAELELLKEKADEERDATLKTLRELRGLLDGFRVAHEEGAVKATITAVGVESPTAEPDDVRLNRELADKDTLLRSLTAQLEERDDRIRALTRRAAGQGPADEMDESTVMELEERVQRLQEELDNERDARIDAESKVSAAGAEPDDAVESLSARIKESDEALKEARERAFNVEKDVESLRTVCASTRQELEELLDEGAAEGAAAERLGALLSVLSRF